MMMVLNLPYHEKLHKWIGYARDVNAIAIWWEKGKLMVGDGFNEFLLPYTTPWMCLETDSNFGKIFRAYDYGKFQDQEADEQCVIVLDNTTQLFYHGPKGPVLNKLEEKNRNKALTLDSYGNSVLNQLKALHRWGSSEPQLADAMRDIFEKTYQKPTYEEFGELLEWKARAQKPQLGHS